MTGKEYNILDEIRADIKTLLSFMATSNERAKHCSERFITLQSDINKVDSVAQWSKWKIVFFSGGMTLLGVVIGILIKLR